MRRACIHEDQAPAASLTERLGQFKLSVGQYPIENHGLGIALPELYQRPPMLHHRLFLLKTSRLSNSTSSPSNTVITVRRRRAARRRDVDCHRRVLGKNRQSTIENHRLGIALLKLHLKYLPYCNSVFFFQNK